MTKSIIQFEKNLPENIKDLAKFVLIGREQLTAVRAKIRAIDKLDLAKDVREQKKSEAHDMASALLDAEVKLGDMIKKLPKESGKRTDLQPGSIGVTRLQEIGISKKQSHFFQKRSGNCIGCQPQLLWGETEKRPHRYPVLC